MRRMTVMMATLAGLGGLAQLGAGLAAEGITATPAAGKSQVIESEEHYVRGLRDRTNLLGELNKVALEKASSPAVQTYARRTSAEFPERMKSVAAIAAQLGIAGVGGVGGAGGPANRGAAPSGAAGSAPNGGAGAPAASGPGGPGAGGRGGGPNARNQATLALLNGLGGADFDRQFLLVTLQQLEEIERNVLGELMLPRGNAALAAWSKGFVVPYARDASVAQALVLGNGDGNPVQPARADDPNRKGPTLEQMLPGALFGLTIDGK